jgi:MIP family channel proteins
VVDRELGKQCVAEVIGTFLLVFFGIGSVHAAVITGAQVGLWQVAVVWGIGIALAIYATSAVSGAHLNPSITLALATYRGFPWRKVAPYILAQLVGAVLAASVLYGLFHGLIGAFEAAHHLVRGGPGSELSAMIYGEYFPNPAMLASTPALAAVTMPLAMLAEIIGTAGLAFMIFAVTDEENPGRPASYLAPLFIGLTVSLLISTLAPISMAGLNPARDLGPRLVAYFAGWGSVAIPGPHGGFFTVYILSPIIGALIGGGVFTFLLRPTFAVEPTCPLDAGICELEETPMKQTRLILVGGFLGAGKTTLLARAAALLLEQKKRVALITNDQAADLVDTALLRQAQFHVQEIAGGCFCCRFGQLIDTAEQLVAEWSPDIIMGEPVGSCTDLSATVLQPIKDLYGEAYDLAPLSVLVDPERLWEILDPQRPSPLHPSARYILGKQAEEADVLVLNKSDLLSPAELVDLVTRTREVFSSKPLHIISALTGEGVAGWLEAVLGEGRVGTRIAEVDYEVYAEGEAVLGWLNAAATVTATTEVDWREWALGLLDRLQHAAVGHQAEIAHVKLSLTAPSGQYVANLTSTTGTPTLRGRIDGAPRVVALVLNARVEMAPEALQTLVEEALKASAGEGLTVRVDTIRSLSPGRPTPTHRYASVV